MKLNSGWQLRSKFYINTKFWKMTNLFKWLTVAAFALSCSLTNTFAQSNSDVITALNEQLIPLKTLSTEADFTDLEKVKNILKGKAIIGIGEATHGTHEFFVFKHRMLEFLVKELGVKTIVIEADFAGTQLMNDFVVNGKGSAEQSIWSMGFSGTTQEFVDLANWLKSYNETQLPENKVQFYGCDMQYGTFAAKTIKNYLEQRNLLTPEMSIGLDAMNKFMPALTATEKTAIRNTVINLSSIRFADHDTAKNAMYKRDFTQLQQFVDYMDAQSKNFPAKQSDMRDKYMAENCEFIYNYTHHNKMMIWAHNEHIRKSAGSDGYHRMGILLAQAFNDKYYAMGFDFYSGKMRSFDTKLKKNVAVNLPSAKAESSGAIFSQCNTPNFIFDFKSACANLALNSFLNSKIQSSFFGAEFVAGQAAHYVTQKLADTFDAIIFIRETNASMDIKTPN